MLERVWRKGNPRVLLVGVGIVPLCIPPETRGSQKRKERGKKKKKKNLTAAAQAAVEANGLKDPVLLWLQRRSQLWLGFNP